MFSRLLCTDYSGHKKYSQSADVQAARRGAQLRDTGGERHWTSTLTVALRLIAHEQCARIQMLTQSHLFTRTHSHTSYAFHEHNTHPAQSQPTHSHRN